MDKSAADLARNRGKKNAQEDNLKTLEERLAQKKALFSFLGGDNLHSVLSKKTESIDALKEELNRLQSISVLYEDFQVGYLQL
jgi:GTP cyclohydrolase III